MAETKASEGRSTSLAAKILLVVGGIAAALLLATLALALFPGLIPRGVQTNSYQRTYAGVVMEVEYRISDGDLFAWLPGRVRPPREDAVLEKYTLSWDADGFRTPARQADHYPIAAFGDSFTEAADVPAPWPDKLAELLDVPVRNYGYRGYGPLETARAVENFAAKEARSWVLYAFFSGNDLSEANRTELLKITSPFDLWPHLIRQAAANTAPTATPLPEDAHYDYPLPVIIGGSFYEMAFLPYYMWWQLAPPEGFAASRSFQSVGDVMATAARVLPASTCRALVFIPTKEQLYYPYIHPNDHQWIRSVGQTTYIDDEGRLQLRDRPFSADEEDLLIASLTQQRDAVAELVASQEGWHFIDLLPAFQEAVGRGELLYYPYDTHWNQAGHQLAAQVIADALRAVPECPLRVQ